MGYQLKIVEKPTYLHAIFTGQNSKENLERCLQELMSECLTRHCYRVLIEERLEGPRLNIVDLFKVVMEASSRAAGAIKAAAYVDFHREEDLMRFAENVAVNRGLPTVVVSTVAEAEEWLLSQGH